MIFTVVVVATSATATLISQQLEILVISNQICARFHYFISSADS